jgi:hypothetical protein
MQVVYDGKHEIGCVIETSRLHRHRAMTKNHEKKKMGVDDEGVTCETKIF